MKKKLHDKEIFISLLELDCVKHRMIKTYGWTEKQADKGCLQYKRFLWLKYWYGDSSIVIPSLDIDEIWHNHILFTKKYHDDCEIIFGKYLHHQPQHGNGDMTETEIERMFHTMTQRSYFQEFGEYIDVVNSKLYKSNYWSKFYEKIIKLFVRHKKS